MTKIERGANWVKATALAPIVKKDTVVGLIIRTPKGATDKLYAEVLIDTSGCATFLANHRVTGKKTSVGVVFRTDYSRRNAAI